MDILGESGQELNCYDEGTAGGKAERAETVYPIEKASRTDLIKVQSQPISSGVQWQ